MVVVDADAGHERKIMRFMTRELPMSRLAMYAASLAIIGFIGGAVVGSQSRAHRVAGQSEPIRQTEENAVKQEAEPQRVDPLAAESAPAEAGVASAGATGPQAAPPNPAVTGLGPALELYRKGDMTGGDRAKSELPDPLDRELSEWAAVHFGLVSFDPYRGLYARASRLAGDGRAAKGAAFLGTVDGVVGRVEIEDDLLGRVGVRLQEQLDEEPLDRRLVMRDLVIARRLRPAQLKPVQRALARNRSAIRAPRHELAGQHRHRGVMAQMLMVVEVLVSERDSEHALGDERRHVVLDQVRPARIHEAACKAPNQADDAVGRPEQKRAGIGGDRPAVETRLHPTALNRCKIK